MAASVGANVAMSPKRAKKSSSRPPRDTPNPAVTSGRPAASSEPKAMSRMTRATSMPMPSELGGSWPANWST